MRLQLFEIQIKVPIMLAYLHIPYCDSKCYYCSFNSYTDKFDTRADYMLALHSQLEHELKRFGAQNSSIDTLFIGGGTPSTVSPDLYEDIFRLLKPYLKQDAEITAEVNPNSGTKEWISGMMDLGVNRMSFGVQSFEPQKLKALNRAHSPDQAEQSIMHAYDAGIKHISLDIIYNYQGDTRELLLNDIDRAFSLPIDHISAYELTIESGTKFAQTPHKRQENDELAFFVADEIISRGFAQYEISNFGKYQSLHNKGYWHLDDYIGAGAGAVGFLSSTRYYPCTDIDRYILKPTDIREEHLTDQEILTEQIFLGLRSVIGVNKTLFDAETSARAKILIEEGRLIESATHYYNTNYFLSDEVALYLIQ